MSTSRNNFSYSRTIRLAPAVGDWTTIQYREDLDSSHVSSIQNTGFNSLAKDKLRYSHLAHYRLGEVIINKLSSDLSIKVELHSITAAQLSYQDFLVGFQEPCVQYHFTIPTVGKISMILEWSLADFIIQRLTGGTGADFGQDTDFSDIELSILQTQIEQLLPFFSQSWKSLFSPEQIQVESGTGPVQFDPKMSLREAITVFTFLATYGNENMKRFSLMYPSEALRKLLQAKSALPDPMRRHVWLHSKTLRSIKTDVKAIVGKTSLTMKELRDLQVGDIIPLDTSLNSPLELVLGKSSRFQMQAGVSQNRLCGQIIFMDSDYSVPPALPHIPHDTPFSAAPVSQPTPQPAPTYTPPPPPDFSSIPPPPALVHSDHDDFDASAEEEPADDWSAGYAPSSTQSQNEDYESFDEEDDAGDYASSDELDSAIEQVDDNLGEWGSFTVDAPPSSAPAPSHKASSPPQEDDLSWDSLDDHF